jgi:hypothetical protein
MGAMLLIGLPATSVASPVYWEADYGPALSTLTGEDEATAESMLSFSLPVAGTTYNTAYVSTNGYLNLGSNAGYPYSDPLPADLLDSSAPLIASFFADLDLLVNGTVHFNDLGDRAVFTWDQVGSWMSPSERFTFQTVLFPSGIIWFSYNGIPDTLTHLDTNLLVGVGPGGGAGDPGDTDLSTAHYLTSGSTVYQLFEAGQHRFDLDNLTLSFTPSNGGYQVNVVPEPSSVLLFFGGMVGLVAVRRVRRRS